jgi:cytochrome c oxidase assembly factor CtaG
MSLRSLSMLAGLAVLSAAMVPATTLTRHMLELVAVMFVAAPLIAWPLPLPLARPGGDLGIISAAFAAFVGAQWLVHTPWLLEQEARRPLLHGLIQAGLLAVAVGFWSAVLAWPARRSPAAPIVCLLLSMPAGDALSVWLMTTASPIYEGYGLSDQRAAAAVMLSGSIVLGACALALGWRAVSREQTAQLLEERGELRRV